MLFSSTVFLFGFLPIVLAVYFVAPRPLRNAVLLLASLFFYAWGETFLVLLMLVSIAANYGFGHWVAAARARASDPEHAPARGGRLAVAAAVVFNLGLLVFFKYADWIWHNLNRLYVRGMEYRHPLPPVGHYLAEGLSWGEFLLEPDRAIHLPIGISFFTFQALSYVVDVHRGEGRPQRNPVDFALYIALFPQLIAGPIVRYRDVAEQLLRRHVDLEGFAEGVRRFVLGLGKKMLVANGVARVADDIFALPTAELTPAVAWLGIAAYTLQIYFDFSGYSDMAIGLGRMFGFRFLENFDYPYVSRSITEFWRRWHISLSSWFRDYLYIPLGGNRKGSGRTYLNLVLVFFLCGLWHGASWSFVVWGLFHGAFLVVERVGLKDLLDRAPALARHAYVLLAVMVGWVFFRAETLEGALGYLRAMAFLQEGLPAVHHLDLHVDAWVGTLFVAGAVGSLPWLPALRARLAADEAAGRRPVATAALGALGVVALFGVLVLSALELSAGTYNPFIYFRF